MNKKWVVFLDINSFFLDAYSAANELGLKVFYIYNKGHRPHADALLLCTVSISIELKALSKESVLEIIKSNVNVSEVIGVWTLKDQYVPLASEINRECFHHQNEKHQPMTAALCKNKFLLRKRLAHTKYNPSYAVLNENSCQQNPLPNRIVVIKPLLGYSSIGVEILNPDSNFTEAISRTRSTLNNISDSILGSMLVADYKNLILVEEYIEGEEFSVEIFASQGNYKLVGCCSKTKMPKPYFEEISYLFEAQLSSLKRTQLERAAFEVASSIGLFSGPAHMEFILNQEGPKLLDVGLRLGGAGLTHYLAKIASGVNLVKAVLAEFSHQSPVPFLKSSKNDLGLLFLTQVESGGTIQELPVFKSNLMGAELINSDCFVNLGDKLRGYPNYSGLPGYCLYQIKNRNNDSYKLAVELVSYNLKNYKIKYESK